MNDVDNSNLVTIEPLPEPDTNPDIAADQRRVTIIIILVAILLLILTLGSFFLLMRAQPTAVAQLRDVFIIFLALQSLLIGLVLVILMIQLARLINLLQNEIKPILESTNETVSNLRGTTTFLGDNVVEPIIKMNEYMAGIMRLVAVLGLTRRKKT